MEAVDVVRILRKTGLTKRELEMLFNFPRGTLENWGCGVTAPTQTSYTLLQMLDFDQEQTMATAANCMCAITGVVLETIKDKEVREEAFKERLSLITKIVKDPLARKEMEIQMRHMATGKVPQETLKQIFTPSPTADAIQ